MTTKPDSADSIENIRPVCPMGCEVHCVSDDWADYKCPKCGFSWHMNKCPHCKKDLPGQFTKKELNDFIREEFGDDVPTPYGTCSCTNPDCPICRNRDTTIT